MSQRKVAKEEKHKFRIEDDVEEEKIVQVCAIKSESNFDYDFTTA